MTAIGLRTLVLNNNYMPISVFPLHTIPVEDAITRVFNGTCHVVEEFDREIKTPTIRMKWPSIIARHDSKMVKERIKLTTESLYYRDHGKCMYCEKQLMLRDVTCDHVLPESKGGRFSWDNIVVACQACNLEKGSALPKGKWVPRFMPRKPSYYELLNRRKKFPITIDQESWIPYLGNWEAPIIVRT